MDQDKIRLRIRHFLLQQSSLFRRSVAKNEKNLPSVSAMAHELSKLTGMPSRRLQKYLTKNLGPKEVSISLLDLELIAKMQNLSLSHFLAYLLEEKIPTQSSVKQNVLDFFQNLHEGHRRSLSATLCSGKDQKKSERLIDLIIRIYPLNEADIFILESISDAFQLRRNQAR